MCCISPQPFSSHSSLLSRLLLRTVMGVESFGEALQRLHRHQFNHGPPSEPSHPRRPLLSRPPPALAPVRRWHDLPGQIGMSTGRSPHQVTHTELDRRQRRRLIIHLFLLSSTVILLLLLFTFVLFRVPRLLHRGFQLRCGRRLRHVSFDGGTRPTRGDCRGLRVLLLLLLWFAYRCNGGLYRILSVLSVRRSHHQQRELRVSANHRGWPWLLLLLQMLGEALRRLAPEEAEWVTLSYGYCGWCGGVGWSCKRLVRGGGCDELKDP